MIINVLLHRKKPESMEIEGLRTEYQEIQGWLNFDIFLHHIPYNHSSKISFRKRNLKVPILEKIGLKSALFGNLTQALTYQVAPLPRQETPEKQTTNYPFTNWRAAKKIKKFSHSSTTFYSVPFPLG